MILEERFESSVKLFIKNFSCLLAFYDNLTLINVFNDKEALIFKIDYVIKPNDKINGISYNIEDDLASDGSDLSFPSDTIIKADTSTFIDQEHCVELEIIYNPIFQIPCPYARIWNKKTGQVLSVEDAQHLIDSQRSWSTLQQQHRPSNSSHPAAQIDHSYYPFGQLMLDFHPLSDSQPCLSLHCCDLARRLEPIMLEQQQAS